MAVPSSLWSPLSPPFPSFSSVSLNPMLFWRLSVSLNPMLFSSAETLQFPFPESFSPQALLPQGHLPWPPCQGQTEVIKELQTGQ